MVMNMTDKEDPNQKNIPVDFEDDDDIIVLTNEVVLKPKKDDQDRDLQGTAKDVPKTQAAIPAESEQLQSGSDGKDDIYDREPAPESDSEMEGTILDLDEAFLNDQPPMDEDEIIASAIAESLGPDDEEPEEDRIKLSGEADSNSAKEDDVIVTDRAPETAEKDAEVFDTEEEIELEYQSNEDEYDFFAMDDKQTLEDLDTISMTDDKPGIATEGEVPFEPPANLSFNTEEDDEIIAMAADSHAEPELMAFEDEETLEFEGAEELPDLADKVELEGADDLPDLTDEMEFESAGDLPDLTDEMEFEGDDDLPDLTDEMEFESAGDLPDLTDEMEVEGDDDLPDLTDDIEFEFGEEDEDNGLAAATDQDADSSDDTVASTVEKSLPPDEVTTLVDLAMEPEFEFADDGDVASDEPERAEQEDFAAKTKEELRALAEADDLPDIDDEVDLEFEDEEAVPDSDHSDAPESDVEVLALEDLEDNPVEEEDDVIEITEFDEHFPEEAEKRLERAGVLNASNSDEGEFLELIEIEDDDMSADEEVIKFSNSEDQIDEDEIDNFFSDSLEDEPAFENEEDETVEGEPAMSTDMAMATASTADEEDEFNFDFNSSEISQQVDRLDTFLSDDSAPEPDVASLPDEQFAEEDFQAAPHPGATLVEEDQPEGADIDAPLPVSPDQIDAILERVIKEKFGGKIENVIYEVIQKTVSKEIDRLKGALLSDSDYGDDE
jgi:pilus assembly protein FimV